MLFDGWMINIILSLLPLLVGIYILSYDRLHALLGIYYQTNTTPSITSEFGILLDARCSSTGVS